jgi:hypothetical protein
LYDRHDLQEKMFGVAKKLDIHTIFHTGDLLDGIKVYRGQEYEQDASGCTAQVKHVVDTWPENKGTTTYFIGGNHDYSFVRHGGFEPCEAVQAGRPDMRLLGLRIAIVGVKVSGTPISVALMHPDGGTPYAVSYRPQKIVEQWPGGSKPHILLMGHFHKAEFLPQYRNVAVFQTGCLQSQTPSFMLPRGIAAHLGFWIVEVNATKQGLASVSGRFVSFFEEQAVLA